jgi:hypothetical protein
MKRALCIVAAALGLLATTPAPSEATILDAHLYAGAGTGAFVYSQVLAVEVLPLPVLNITMWLSTSAGATIDQYGEASTAVEGILCQFTGQASESLELGLSSSLSGSCASGSTGSFPCTVSYARVGTVVLVSGQCHYHNGMPLNAAMAWVPFIPADQATMGGVVQLGP